MMKKDIKIITLSVALTTFAFTSCSRFVEEDLFEESAALRIEHNADKLQEILVNAPQGWVMQYYTGRGVSVFEGFNLFAKFERNGKVTLAGNHRFLRDGNAGKYTEASSLYELIREDGLVLAFNTWNDILTPFVDPVPHWLAPDSLYWDGIQLKDGVGMEGDQNLVVTFMSENEIRFRGERHNAQIRMVKADRDWQTYIKDTEEIKARFISNEDSISSYYITDGDTAMYFVGLRYGRYRFSELMEGYLKNDSLSCCFTPTGFRNERPDTINGHIFQEFKMNEDGSALVNEDGTVWVTGTWDKYLASRKEVMWIDSVSMSPNLMALYDQLKIALKTNDGSYPMLLRIGMGESQTQKGKVSVNGLVIEWKPSKRAQPKTGGMALIRSVPTMGQMSIIYDEGISVFDNELVDLETPAIGNAVRKLGATLAGTYQMTPNSNFMPTAAQFHSIDSETSFSISSEIAE